jgi:hypothetical protein
MLIEKAIELEIVGPGIILYSPFAVRHIGEGEDYLAADYGDSLAVQRHIQAGTIIGFGTSSPGRYHLNIRSGYPAEGLVAVSEFKLRLAVRVQGRVLCFRDLYDLMDWTVVCPEDQQFSIDDGIYHVTLCGDRPPSGRLGDDQTIGVFLQPLNSFPRLATAGIPTYAC